MAAPNERVVSALLAAGVAMKPEFEGSDKYEVVPLLLANVKWGGVELQLRGLEARVDLFADSPWDFGPVVNYRGKRDDDVSGPVKRLAEIDGAVEGGGFLAYAFGGDRNGQGEIRLEATVLHDVSGEHDGFTASGGVSYAALRWGPVYANVDAQTTYASKDFNRTYFGVTRAGSIASGLKAYRPGAGFKDVSAGVTAGYQFNEQWGLVARAEVTRYVGDAADSPIVKDGSKTSALLGLGVSYRY
ncbi:MipA/OmpV family protein [Chenggangzhangella methanolivorans]|uniref:MipA/OmpV family protein n=1 Tax=Chenggangzhangella methanolivorans TaxID=1437009 RepID=A0A9E6UKS8_9HYPH|nr:MipA/OmpV family protein [Chenggangzhangella methanolivorans]QZN98245.1 MipA/OmpV family protein [Chenggangzhangella methanolivorans]